MPVDASGARARSERISEMIRARLREAMPEVIEAMTASAVSRAPSMDEEYNELNAEGGGVPQVGRSGGDSADTDGRKRFIKDESTYIVNAIQNMQENAQIAEAGSVFSARIGHIPWLQNISHFSYINLGRGHYQMPEVTVPASPAGYFSAFEGGTAGAAVSDGVTTFDTFTVTPHSTKANGQFYPLRPGEGKDGVAKSMIKSISPRGMFVPFYLQEAASAVLSSALAEIGPAHKA